MKRDDLLTTIGLTAIGVVTGTLARALALGGKVVAVGVETLERALGGEPEEATPGSPSGAVPARRPSTPRTRFAPVSEPGSQPDSEPAFEAADGVTPPVRRAGGVPRGSSAGATARTSPVPRPAKRATLGSLPPSVRPVSPMRSHRATPDPVARTREPVKGAAGAAELSDVSASTAESTTANATSAKKAPAKKSTAKKTAAKKTAAKTTAAKKTAAKTTAANTTSATAGSAKKAAAKATSREKATAKATSGRKTTSTGTAAAKAAKAAKTAPAEGADRGSQE